MTRSAELEIAFAVWRLWCFRPRYHVVGTGSPDRLGFLERTGEITDPAGANRLLSETVERSIRRAVRSRLLLSNQAIEAYRRAKKSNVVPIKCVRKARLRGR